MAALEREREQLATDLAHRGRLSALGMLAAGIGHENQQPLLRHPLQHGGAARAAETIGASRPKERAALVEGHTPDWLDSVADCIAAAGRINTIVKALGIFSRKTDRQPTEIDVNDEIQMVLQLMGKEVAFHAKIEVALTDPLPRVSPRGTRSRAW